LGRVEALVTPSVMRWAREQANLSIDEAAQEIKRQADEIRAWEDGSVRPSIAQARKAAEIYRRPLAVFYLPEPPQDFETLRDFRSLPDTVPGTYSRDLALLIRTTQFRQHWMREYLLNDEMDRLTFVGSASLSDSPRQIALDILRVIELTPTEQKECSSRYEALRLWIHKSEAAGIFIFRQGQIALEEVRGFVISDDIAPFVFINSDDSKAGQLFTLAHELAHLWLNLSGISNLASYGGPSDRESREIETFCNKVAAEAVLEDEAFFKEWHTKNTNSPIEEKIQHISGTFKVSEEVVARRLRDEEIIDQDYYLELREAYQERWAKHKARERERLKMSKGGPSYYVTSVAKNGYAFTQTVVGGFMTGAISGRDASALLNVKVDKFRRLGETAGIPTSAWEGPRG